MNCVLLQKDIPNAFNEVLPYEFLKDAEEYAPSSARFAAFCYGTPSHFIYNGDVTMCYRGQQGCPIMGSLLCLTGPQIWNQHLLMMLFFSEG